MDDKTTVRLDPGLRGRFLRAKAKAAETGRRLKMNDLFIRGFKDQLRRVEKQLRINDRGEGI